MQDTINKYLIPLVNCPIVKGAKRALLCDLQRCKYIPVPLSFAHLIDENKGKKIEDIYVEYRPDNKEALDEFFDFMIEGDYLFLSEHQEDADRFSELPHEFEAYETIQNAIIDIGDKSDFDIADIIKQLIELDCQSIQVRSYRSMDVDELIQISSYTEETECRNIEFIVPYHSSFCSNENLTNYFFFNQRIGGIICYDAPENSNELFVGGEIYISLIKEKIIDERNCGVCSIAYFTSNLQLYLESHNYNSCLHRKICIDKNGFIKNCPSLQQDFGSIKNTSLEEVVSKPEFKKYWNISKHNINVCKDCEYRYVCTDCRAYIENPEDIYSKPLKCGYNPYTATWSDWTTNPLKQNSITHYHLQEIIQL